MMKKDKKTYQKPKVKSSKIKNISFYSRRASYGQVEEGMLLAVTII